MRLAIPINDTILENGIFQRRGSQGQKKESQALMEQGKLEILAVKEALLTKQSICRLGKHWEAVMNEI